MRSILHINRTTRLPLFSRKSIIHIGTIRFCTSTIQIGKGIIRCDTHCETKKELDNNDSAIIYQNGNKIWYKNKISESEVIKYYREEEYYLNRD